MTHLKKGCKEYYCSRGCSKRYACLTPTPRLPVLFQNRMKEREVQAEMLWAHVCICLKKSISALLPWEITVCNFTLTWVVADFTCSSWGADLSHFLTGFRNQFRLQANSSVWSFLWRTSALSYLPYPPRTYRNRITALRCCAHKAVHVHLDHPLPQTKLCCKPWILKTGERFQGRRRETYPLHKQTRVLHP